ncbi:MAG: alkaline phosphatase family protein [Nitrospirae bacterium]|nr:alkaline phosphatase family protein [Nitrospirota bacterium]
MSNFFAWHTTADRDNPLITNKTAVYSPALAAALLALASPDAHAYIGPGAGFAFIGSFFVMFTAIFIATIALLVWPVRMLIFFLRRKKGYTKTDVGRVVVVGLDGLDPKLARRHMDQGLMPNFKAMAEKGTFKPLQTTCPSISPVAWSSFATGLTPARHGIFDFLDRDLKTYLPILSSAKIGTSSKVLKLGKYRIPLKKPPIKLLRKGTPFWHFLGEKGVSCSVLRVPITFPPAQYEGRELSAMCVPDLKGSQGTFSFYTEDEAESKRLEGGQVFVIKADGDTVRTHLHGPHNTFVEGAPICKAAVTINIDRAKGEAAFSLDDADFKLTEGVYSPWIKVGFALAPKVAASGICRFLVSSFTPFRFYVTPINIDPEAPALPISHPQSYAVYLGKLLGSYATLGLAEDTWALNEKVLTDGQFMEQCYDIHAEREAMLFNELDNVRKGLVVCVFDATDRMQHMFWRYTDPGHPALEGASPEPYKDAIKDLYAKMDGLIERVQEKLNPDDMLIVMSDHGFASFRRGVNLNTWLYDNGYLKLKEGKTPSDTEWFKDVDWKKTVAYGVGLGGICLNIKGRESQGVVEPGKMAEFLKADIKKKLAEIVDEAAGGKKPIRNVYDLKELYKGPYLDNGPELVVGFDDGYRVSWDCAKGVVSPELITDNLKSWSGDHCTDFSVVPGVLFCNRVLPGERPRIIDIGPTVIKAFGMEVPKAMEGRPLI